MKQHPHEPGQTSITQHSSNSYSTTCILRDHISRLQYSQSCDCWSYTPDPYDFEAGTRMQTVPLLLETMRSMEHTMTQCKLYQGDVESFQPDLANAWEKEKREVAGVTARFAGVHSLVKFKLIQISRCFGLCTFSPTLPSSRGLHEKCISARFHCSAVQLKTELFGQPLLVLMNPGRHAVKKIEAIIDLPSLYWAPSRVCTYLDNQNFRPYSSLLSLPYHSHSSLPYRRETCRTSLSLP